MDFTELTDTIRELCRIGGYAEGDPPPDWARLINEAYREMASEAEFNWEDTTFATVIDTAEYSLLGATDLRDWIRITDVLYGTTIRLYETSELAERQLNPLWTQAASATPSRWFLSLPNRMRLRPTPNAVATIYVHGCRNPT